METEVSNLWNCPAYPIIMDGLAGELRWLGQPVRLCICQISREKRSYTSGSTFG